MAILTPTDALTAREAAPRFGITRATIRKWASLGKLHPVGINQSGAKLYRLIDVARCEKATRSRAGRHRQR